MTWAPPPGPAAELAEVQAAVSRVLQDQPPYPRVLEVLRQRRAELQQELARLRAQSTWIIVFGIAPRVI